MTPVLLSLLLGGLMIVIIGMIDDVFRIKPYAKLIIQLIAAVFPIMEGVTIDFFSIGGETFDLGMWSKPITLLWILLVTNAVNLIDGLDGLSCGVSAIWLVFAAACDADLRSIAQLGSALRHPCGRVPRLPAI